MFRCYERERERVDYASPGGKFLVKFRFGSKTGATG